ncbi:MAG: hypothetical protein WC335_02185 [Candidatus Omnitrophota bacterium]|jgi:hypothetical protein
MTHRLNVKTILVLILAAVTVNAAIFFIGQEKEKLRRIKLEELLKLTVADVDRKIEESVKQVSKEKDSLFLELQKEKEWSSSLEKQIKDKDAQIQLALARIDEKDRINADIFEKLKEEERRNTKLELDLRQIQTEFILIKKENEDLKQPLK